MADAKRSAAAKKAAATRKAREEAAFLEQRQRHMGDRSGPVADPSKIRAETLAEARRRGQEAAERAVKEADARRKAAVEAEQAIAASVGSRQLKRIDDLTLHKAQTGELAREMRIIESTKRVVETELESGRIVRRGSMVVAGGAGATGRIGKAVYYTADDKRLEAKAKERLKQQGIPEPSEEEIIAEADRLALAKERGVEARQTKIIKEMAPTESGVLKPTGRVLLVADERTEIIYPEDKFVRRGDSMVKREPFLERGAVLVDADGVEQKTQFYVCHDCSGSVRTGHKCVCKTQDQKSIRRLARDLSREQKTRQRRAPAKREEQIVAANSALQARLLAQDAERIQTQREAGKKSSEIAQGEVTLIGPNPSGDASRQNMRTFFMQRAVDRRARAEMLEVKAGRKKVITGRDGKYVMVDEFDAKTRQYLLDDAKKLRRKADEDEKTARRMPVRQEGETIVKRSLEGITLGYGLGALAIAGFGAYLLYSMFQRDPRDDKRAA